MLFNVCIEPTGRVLAAKVCDSALTDDYDWPSLIEGAINVIALLQEHGVFAVQMLVFEET